MDMSPRRQGDFGEFSAIEWFGLRGIPVYVPIGHSPDVDLVAWMDGRFVGVQVKTSGSYVKNGRYSVSTCTRGGNQSWSGLVKRFSATRCDYLFVLIRNGRRWLIPSAIVEGGTSIIVGGPKYAAYEIERGQPFPTTLAA
jgi:hypothetical protein